MRILKVFPKVVGATSTLYDRFVVVGQERGLTREVAESLRDIIPITLLNAPCFLDRLTDLWRYEFGDPFDRLPNDRNVWATNMWIPVAHLFNVVRCASMRLPPNQQRQYLQCLADPSKHQDVLAEFAPVLHLNPAAKTDFEVSGLGVGNLTIDWGIQVSQDRRVLFDVKRRTKDFIEFAERLIMGYRDEDGTAPAPIHDCALLFRSVEKKFLPHDPDTSLQGVWIVMDVQQEEQELSSAFEAMDHQKIHFVVLGDWDEGVHILVRRPIDKPFLLTLFGPSGPPRGL